MTTMSMPEQLKTTTAEFKKVQKRKRGKRESLIFKRGKGCKETSDFFNDASMCCQFDHERLSLIKVRKET